MSKLYAYATYSPAHGILNSCLARSYEDALTIAKSYNVCSDAIVLYENERQACPEGQLAMLVLVPNGDESTYTWLFHDKSDKSARAGHPGRMPIGCPVALGYRPLKTGE